MFLKGVTTLLIALLFSSFNQVHAGHFADMEIFYRWVSDSTYEFTAVYNRNCAGVPISAPNTVPISISSASNAFNSSITCSKLPSSGPGVPPLVIPNLFNCISNSQFCTEEHVYRGTWTSPLRADDWVFSYSTCCLPAGALGPTNVGPGALYTSCGLNNLDFPDTLNKNNSPFWHNMRPNHQGHPGDTLNNPPHISMCEARPQFLDQSTKNYDNDFIKYEFMQPTSSATANLAYANGWSISNLMPSTTGPITIDSLTGAIGFTPGSPTGSGIYLITIKATEYRNDTVIVGPSQQIIQKEIGYVERNLFVYLNDSATCPGGFLSYADTNGMSTGQRLFNCPEQAFEIQFTDNFICSSLDSNGSDILIRHAASNVSIPIKKVVSNGCNSSQTSDRFIVFIDTVLQADTFELMIKTGADSNTLVTQCQFEIEPYADTLQLIFLQQPLGELQGDKIGPGNFNTVIQIECRDSNFVVNLSENVMCSSIAIDGSDFELYNSFTNTTVPIRSAVRNCNAGMSRSVVINSDPIDPGNYWLRLKVGSDTNRLTNVCSDEWLADSILVVSTGIFPNLGKDTARCEDDTLFQYILNPGPFDSYKWSTGNTAASIFINVPSTYWVEVSNEYGCTASDTMVLSIKDCYLGINTLDESVIDIYPNPAQSVIYIESDESIEVDDVAFYNLIGETVSVKVDKRNARLTLNVSSLEDGVYFMKIDMGQNQIISKKVIIKKD